MNTNIKTRWLAALRSDAYKQGQGRLTVIGDDGRYDCCLGVLCDLAVQDGVILTPTVSSLANSDVKVLVYAGRSDVLPDAVVHWAGLDDPNPEIDYRCSDGHSCYALSGLNDEEALEFKEIADVIEELL